MGMQGQTPTAWWSLVERYMVARGWNARTFAREVGVSSGIVSRWKQGARPSVDNINRVAMVTGLSREEMFAAAGYDVTASGGTSLPDWLAELLAGLTPFELAVVGETARGLLRLRAERQEDGVPPPRTTPRDERSP